MGKFRSRDRHKLDLQNFSIGSKITAGPGDPEWLVVETKTGEVGLLNLKTFKVSGSISVVDPHWLTIDEAGAISGVTGLSYTRSDYEYDEKGLKK